MIDRFTMYIHIFVIAGQTIAVSHLSEGFRILAGVKRSSFSHLISNVCLTCCDNWPCLLLLFAKQVGHGAVVVQLYGTAS